MLRVTHEAAVCYARDNVLSERSSVESRKQTINRALQLLKWLLDANPSLTGWKSNGAAKLTKLDDSFETTVVKMIEGGFWKKQLSGWKEVGSAMIALFVMVEDGELSEFASYVVDRCKHENDDLRKRMHERELRFLPDGEEPPALESVERRDVSAEAKWSRTHAFLKGNDLKGELEGLISALDLAALTGEPPRGVLEMLKKLPRPPGYKTLEERQEEERLMRARELAEDEDF
jgi:hypothetical protein